MKLRIRPALFSDLASSYRAVNSRSSSSASTSTSTSRKSARPRRPDIPDELREQGIAPETILTSTTAGTQSKSYRAPSAWMVHSTGEEPHLKANPWADTYKINHSEIAEQDVDTLSGALHGATKVLDQMNDPAESTTSRSRHSDYETSSRRPDRPHSFGLSHTPTSSSRAGQSDGTDTKEVLDRAHSSGLSEPRGSSSRRTRRSERYAAEQAAEKPRSVLLEEVKQNLEASLGAIDRSEPVGSRSQGQGALAHDIGELSRTRPEISETDAGNDKQSSASSRTIRFSTTESVQIRFGRLSYYHGDHVSDKQWYQGSETEISYYSLRDACPCPKCIDPSTRQRSHTSPEAYREINNSLFTCREPDHSMMRHETSEGEEGLRIDWSPEHSVFFPVSRLRAIAVPGASLMNRLPDRGARRVWTAKTIVDSEHLHVQFEDLISDSGREEMLYNTLQQLHAYGIVVIKGVPTVKTDNENCSLREVMGMIGEIRNTFYGETWNVRNVANSKNVAYTDVNLGLHADLLYFSSPPRFQALHCLRNRVEGGSSYFVDSFGAVRHMLRDNPDYKVPKIDFEYDNDGHYLEYTHPLFSGEKEGNFHWLNSAVNWSPPFQGLPRTVTRRGYSSANEWYNSLDLFQKVLEQPHREWEFTMEEGDLVLFDNRRVLHARRAFRDLTDAEREERGVEIVEGESSRWLKGCYLDGEVVWDKLAVLHQKLHREQ